MPPPESLIDGKAQTGRCFSDRKPINHTCRVIKQLFLVMQSVQWGSRQRRERLAAGAAHKSLCASGLAVFDYVSATAVRASVLLSQSRRNQAGHRVGVLTQMQRLDQFVDLRLRQSLNLGKQLIIQVIFHDLIPRQIIHYSSSALQLNTTYIPHIRVSVVIAKREYEAWFIAAAPSLHGSRGFLFEGGQVNAEEPRNAKGWMSERIQGTTYKEVMDQPAFSAKMDLQQAFDGSRSFRKLCKEWAK